MWGEGKVKGGDGLQRELSVEMGMSGILNVFLVTWASKLFELMILKTNRGKGSHHVAQADLKLMIILPQPPHLTRPA